MKKLPLTIALLTFPCLAAEDDVGLGLEIKDVELLPSKTTGNFHLLPAALKFFEDAEKIVVFEGLPHQTWEEELLKQELEHVEETMIGEFPFYPKPQDFREKDQATLQELLRDPESFRMLIGFTLCGGFHPDYTIRFTKGEEHCDLLLCFGCGEGKFLHNGKVIDCYIFRQNWKELLAGYAKQRPKPVEKTK